MEWALFWTKIPWGIITLLVFTVIPLGIGGFYVTYKRRFDIDVDLHSEAQNGATVLTPLVARIFNDKGLRKIQFAKMFNWNLKELPSPTMDSLVPQMNGRMKISYWRDVYGGFHQMKYTKKIPLTTQIDAETGEVKITEHEIVFTPINESYIEFSKSHLRRLWGRHKDKHWMERYGGLITLMAVGGFVCLIILFMVWFLGGKFDGMISAFNNVADKMSLLQAVTQ